MPAKRKILLPVTPAEFSASVNIPQSTLPGSYTDFFRPYIDAAIHYAIGPFFWFIPLNIAGSIVYDVSENVGTLTPYKKEQWLNKDPEFYTSIIHPDDRYYVLAAGQFAAKNSEQLTPEQRNKVKYNVYARMADVNGKYRWVLFQLPVIYVNKDGCAECALALTTDISHIVHDGARLNNAIMTMIDYSNDEHHYFRIAENKTAITNIVTLSSREKEIVRLMARGLTTPQIAKALFIAYNTVENHKRNLREKTNTKTSAGLMSYIFENGLL